METRRDFRFRDYAGMVLTLLLVVLVVAGMCAGVLVLGNAIVERTEPASIFVLLAISYVAIIGKFVRRFMAKRRRVSSRTSSTHDSRFPPLTSSEAPGERS